MKNFTKNLKSKILLTAGGLGFIMLALVFAVSTNSQQALATTGSDMHGYAWSSTIGWVSLNCAEGSSTGTSVCSTSPYKVTVSPGRVVSGDAWSSNVGWISFDSADTASCGIAAALNLANQFVGYARIISGTVASGADGCINLGLGGSSPAYQVVYSPTAHTVTGFAWGSTNVGWLSFNGTLNFSTSSVDLKITPMGGGTASDGPVTLAVGSTATLSWTSTNAATCKAAPMTTTDWNSTSLAVTGVAPITINGPQTYVISCRPPGGAVDGSQDVTDSVDVTTAGATPAVTLTASPIAVYPGTATPVTLTWSTQYMSSTTACMGSSTPSYPAWNVAHTSSTDRAPLVLPNVTYSLNITAPQTFKLTCTPIGGGTALTATVTVNILSPACAVTPTAVSLAPTGGTIAGTTSFGVTWSNVIAFPLTTLSVGAVTPGAAGVTAAISGTNTITTSAGTVRVATAGPFTATTRAQTVQVTGYGLAGGATIMCAPATFTLANPTPTTPKNHLPWYEF